MCMAKIMSWTVLDQLQLHVYTFFSPGGSDYTPVGPFTFAFNATVNQLSFDVPLIFDEVFEVTESLTSILSFSHGIAPPRASIQDGNTQIRIFNGTQPF